MSIPHRSQVKQLLNIASPSPLETFTFHGDLAGNELWCKRDDLLHPIISGNKWRKLNNTVCEFISQPPSHVASFGGAYSNHLHALAFVCFKMNIPFTAIVRAHPNSPLSPTLLDLINWQAKIHYVNRIEYQQREEKDYLISLKKQLDVDLLIPEGGSSTSSVSSVGELIHELTFQCASHFDTIILPVASGGTMAGIIHYLAQHNIPTKVIGIAVLKGEGYLEAKVQRLLNEATAYTKDDSSRSKIHWQIIHNDLFHCGGYAKTSQAVKYFQHDFFLHTNIPLDKVYNAKSFFATHQLLKQGLLAQNERHLVLHTGGLQGNRV